MNRKWWKFLFLLPISVCTLYAEGYAAQFIKNYQEWTSVGNFAGNGTYPQAASLHPLVCFHTALTDFPYNLYGIFLCLVLFGLLNFLLMRMGYDFPVCRQRAERQQRFRGKFNHYRSQKRTL